jgi:hypothetical protein
LVPVKSNDKGFAGLSATLPSRTRYATIQHLNLLRMTDGGGLFMIPYKNSKRRVWDFSNPEEVENQG